MIREYDQSEKQDKIRRMNDRISLVWRMEEEADEQEEHETIQAKSSLEIGAPDDVYEQQADAVADKIVSGANAKAELNPSLQTVQKKEDSVLMAKGDDDTLHGTEQLQTTLNSSKGGGENLDPKIQSEMGQKMGADLSDVKIHTDSTAHEMSEGINAKAFTHGQDIYFKQGNFDTSSSEGKHLLAHELAHTVQQKGGLQRKIQRKNEKLTDEQRALITRAGFDPESIPEEDAELLASMLSILEKEAAVAEGKDAPNEKRKIGEYELSMEMNGAVKKISLVGKNSSLSLSTSEDDKGATTRTTEFNNKERKYSVVRIDGPPVITLQQPVKQGKNQNTGGGKGAAKGGTLLNNPFELGVPAYKLVKTIKGKGKIYLAENILKQEQEYNPEFKKYGGQQIIYRRSIKIETEDGKEIYISVKGSDAPGLTAIGNLMDVKGKTEMEISINGTDRAKKELQIFKSQQKDNSSINDVIRLLAAGGPPAYLMERVPLDEKYFDEVIKTTSLFWQAPPKKAEEAKPNPDAVKAENSPTTEEDKTSYPSQAELEKMTENERLKLAVSKFWEEFQISTVVKNVLIGIGIAIAVIAAAFAAVALFALEIGAAVIAAIAGAIIGLGFIIYSYWDSVLKPLLSGEPGKIDPPEALKAGLYVVSIILGAVGVILAIPELVTAAVIVFIAAIAVGIAMVIKEIYEASKSLIPTAFKEHTRKAARNAEQVTTDAMIGLILKLYKAVIEPKKPVIGDHGSENKPLPDKNPNQKQGEETVKEMEKTKEEKETVKPEKAEKELVSSPFDKKGKLKPNVKYVSGEFGYQGETDALGRIEKVSTDNLRLSEAERLKHNPKTPGKIEGDHAGHLFGDRFGGSPELDNLVSQTSDVNLSKFKKIENIWAKEILSGKNVEVKIKINYKAGEVRPISFDVEWRIDGRRGYENLKN